ncbi:MAG TPA: protein-disulfide reductase DsbD domain-containing protein [Hyphomicrobium sp.]|jgi:DsbC/DsbD-like thiol-disulfide interchange protein|uniref:protein-disulfide reductase DsbD domain-containing protein n=1 Tax=Hyphomicrobium sp. TaxID=82 RepID=UPI002BB088EF|nr:protein-disulfide reductase DsbD domain-containing protein [Hyphomicrobium sp.]HXE02800.1 protein-disulfide reductase DsbD domain-containing protein [Hyphomicrobium sp.]
MKLALFFLAFSASAAWSSATEPASTEWFQGFNNKARLVAGHAVRDGQKGLYAGVEIEMPSGWDTYWRSPGDAGGVAPEFDWQGSENLDSTHALYPAPQRLHTKAGDVVGYTDRVLFPINLTPKDASKPITLHGKIAYGVCKDICIPAEVELQITIPPGIGASETLTNVLAQVPRPDARPDIDPSLANWRLDQTTGKPKLVLNVATISPASADAFVEAPGGVYVPLPKRVGDAAGKAVFEVDLTDGVDLKNLKGKPLTVTMIDGKGQSETTITLE